MSAMDGYLTVKEATEVLGCSIGFIRVRLQDGRLPSIKLGSRFYVTREDLLSLIETVTPQSNDIKLG